MGTKCQLENLNKTKIKCRGTRKTPTKPNQQEGIFFSILFFAIINAAT